MTAEEFANWLGIDVVYCKMQEDGSVTESYHKHTEEKENENEEDDR